MSVSLPEWKQQLLERKRREEEEKERREHEEEARLANMPAWKRGIIQRRRAKQDGGGGERERERGREEGPIEGELPPPQIATAMDRPVQQNPFIRSQSSWRGRGGLEAGGASGDGAGLHNRGRGQGGEAGPERETGETPEKEREKKEGGERGKKEGRERGNGREADAPTYPRPPRPLGPALRTIRAKNIIIIQKDRDGGREGEEEREAEGVEEEEEEGEEGGVRVDLRKILAGGGSVTEIKASEVLIINPSLSPGLNDRARERQGERDGQEAPVWREKERRERKERGRVKEVETGIHTEGEKEREKGREGDREREREKEREKGREGDRERERGKAETGSGLVSQLLSKFGEQPKPPPRSKSSDCFVPPPRGEGRGPGAGPGRGVPKRSVSFSERPIDQEQGEEAGPELQGRHSDSPVGGAWPDGEGEGPDRGFGAEPKKGVKGETSMRGREREGEREGGREGGDADRGFTLASRRRVEGLGFARRLPVRQEAREKQRMLGQGREAGWRTEGEEGEEAESGRKGADGGEVEEKKMGRLTGPHTPSAECETWRALPPQGHRDPPTGGVEERERGRGSPSCVPKMEPEIQVPRVHFYGEEPTQGAGPGVGRPLTFRAKSLQEKIGRREREKWEREKEREGGEGERGVEEESRTGGAVGEEDGGVERERERRQTAGEREGGVEESGGGGQPSLCSITQEQEVAATKPGPQLPVSAARATGVWSAAAAVAADREAERRSAPPPSPGVQEPGGGRVQGKEKEETEGGEREADRGEMNRRYLPPSFSPSPSPPPSVSLSAPLVGVRRLHGISAASCRGGQRAEPVGQGAEPELEGVAVATLQTSLELLHLREAGAGGRKWPPQLGQKAGGETQPPPQALRGPRALPAPSSQPQTPKPLTISPRTGPTEQGALPAPSSQTQTPKPLTISPRTGPTEQGAPVDPTPAATPPLFSLRSSGGAQGKRGNTITITPRRSPAGLGAVRAGPPTPTGCSITVTPRSTAAPTPTPNGTATEPGDGGKKRYPTAQEIQVIGGYQSLERSCLAKQRRKHKEVKVCFDDTQLEQLCEYPSESAWLACFPCPTQPITEREGQARGVEDEEEEEEEEGGAFSSGNVRIARPKAGRMLRVDESCHR